MLQALLDIFKENPKLVIDKLKNSFLYTWNDPERLIQSLELLGDFAEGSLKGSFGKAKEEFILMVQNLISVIRLETLASSQIPPQRKTEN